MSISMESSEEQSTSPRKGLSRSAQGDIAGVATGIAEYFEKVPLHVKAIFILASFLGGFGIFVYFVAWLLLPAASEDIPEGFSFTSNRKFLVSGLGLLFLGFLFWEPFDFAEGGFIVGCLFIVVGFLLLNDRQVPVRKPARFQESKDQLVSSWAAPQKESPVLENFEPQNEVKKFPIFALTIAGIGISIGLLLLGEQLGWFSLSVLLVIGSIAVVCGAGLIASAFTRRSILLILFSSLVCFFLGVVSVFSYAWDTRETFSYTVDSLEELQPAYSQEVGHMVIDLSALELSSSRTVDVSLDFGEIRVIVPSNTNIELSSSYDAGYVEHFSVGEQVGLDGLLEERYVVSENAPVLRIQSAIVAGGIVIEGSSLTQDFERQELLAEY